MSWALGFDSRWNRDIGYGVPSTCDHPKCRRSIDRGLSYVCGGEPHGGEDGCGLFFCSKHLFFGPHSQHQLCERCLDRIDPENLHDIEPFAPKEDLKKWMRWKLKHKSWRQWRAENPDEVAAIEKLTRRRA